MTWLFSKALCENLHSLPEPVAESLAVIFSDGAPSVQWNETHTPQAFWLRDKMTKSCPFSRFGVMSPHLTADLGEAVLMSYQAAFPARTSVQPEKAQVSTESEAAFGVSSPELLARFDQDTFSWKTPQCSLLEGLDEFSETWPQWGMMQDGVCWGLTMLVRPTKESVFGYSQNAPTLSGNWPTPMARCGTGASNNPNRQGGPDLQTQVGGKLNPDWTEWLMGWPIGWTDLEPLETDKFHWWQQQHLTSYQECEAA